MEKKTKEILPLHFKQLKEEERLICEGLWKIMNMAKSKLAKKLDVAVCCASELKKLAADYLEPIFKNSGEKK